MIYERIFNINNKIFDIKYISELMQKTAQEQTDNVGFSEKYLSNKDFGWIILNWKIKIINSNINSNIIKIKTWAKSFSLSHIYRDFEVFDDKDNLIVIGTSSWALLDFSNRKPVRLTKEMMISYNLEPSKIAMNENFKNKLSSPETPIISKPYTIQNSDLDQNGHVHNTNYLDIIKNVYLNSYDNVEIYFKKEIFLNETVICEYGVINNENYITIKSNDLKTTHAIIKII